MPPIGQKKTGRVIRGIKRAFIAAGNRDLTTSELLVWTHIRALHEGGNSPRQSEHASKVSGELGQMPSRIDRFHGKRNYKRTGRVQRGITRAFIAAGGRDLTIPELMEWTHARALHRGTSARERNYLKGDVRRAAKRMCEQVGRSTGPGRPVLWRLRKPVP